MKISEEYRALALDALRGKWKTAVLAGIIASAFGANIVSGSSSITSRSNQDSSFSMDLFSEPNGGKLLTFLVICIVILAVVTFIAGGFVRLGYARFNLNLVDGENATISDLFSQKNRLKDGFLYEPADKRVHFALDTAFHHSGSCESIQLCDDPVYHGRASVFDCQ